MAYAVIVRGASRLNYTVEASDGSSFSIPVSLCRSLDLHKGDQFTEEEYIHLKRKVFLILSRKKAVELLARREHGEYELQIKLLEKGFDRQIVEETLSSLKEENLQSDFRFAESLIRSRQRNNPEGVPLLRLRLRAKLVDSKAAESAIAKWMETDDNRYQAVKKAIERYLRRHKDSERIVEALQKKGFTRTEVLEVLEDLKQ